MTLVAIVSFLQFLENKIQLILYYLWKIRSIPLFRRQRGRWDVGGDQGRDTRGVGRGRVVRAEIEVGLNQSNNAGEGYRRV